MTDTATQSSREVETIQTLKELYRLARQEKRKNYERWNRNYKLTRNQLRPPNPSYMPSSRDSEVYPILSSLVGWMTDQNTTIEIVPASDPHSQFTNTWDQIARDLENIITTIWHVDKFYRPISIAIWDSFRFDMGILKIVWDQDKAGGLGNPSMVRVDPYAFYVDPNASSFDDSEFFIEVKQMSLAEIERRWPGRSILAEAGGALDTYDKPPGINDGNSSRPFANSGAIAPAVTPRYGSPRQNFGQADDQLVFVYEYWIKENGEPYEDELDSPDEEPPDIADKLISAKWRCVILANNQILMDEDADDLWARGTHPYSRYVSDDLGEMYGISLCDHLAEPQLAINKLLAAMQANAELVGNPIWMEPENAGLARTLITNRPGSRLRISPQAANSASKPGWVEPPTMPPAVQSLVEFWIARMENISGLSAMVKGQTPASRNAEGVMNTIQEAAFVRVRAMLRNLELTLQECATMMADLIIDNYDSPRTMAIVGPQGQKSKLAIQGQHFSVPGQDGRTPLSYTLVINAGASLPTSRQARVAEADKLFAMGAMDPQGVLEAHNYPNRDDILKRINAAKQAGTWSPPGARQRSQRSS